MSNELAALEAMTAVVLAYRPKEKAKALKRHGARRKKRRAGKTSGNGGTKSIS